jgi:hypothetical protein
VALDQAAANDKQVRLAIHAGGTGVPGWIDQLLDVNGGPIASIEATSHDGVTSTMPAFWDDTFISHKKDFFRRMALRYGTHPNVVAIGAPIADPFTGDWGFHRVNPLSAANAGYDSVVFASHWRDLIQEVMIAAPTKFVATAVGSTPLALINLVRPGEDRFYAFRTAMTLMQDDPDVEMSRLVCGKGSLNAMTPNPNDPSLLIPEDLNDWRTIYEAINTYGANGFAQTVSSVTNDPDFKMNAGFPYGGPGEPTRGEVFLDAAMAAAGYELLWLEPWEIDVINDSDPQLQSAVSQAALLFP